MGCGWLRRGPDKFPAFSSFSFSVSDKQKLEEKLKGFGMEFGRKQNISRRLEICTI